MSPPRRLARDHHRPERQRALPRRGRGNRSRQLRRRGRDRRRTRLAQPVCQRVEPVDRGLIGAEQGAGPGCAAAARAAPRSSPRWPRSVRLDRRGGIGNFREQVSPCGQDGAAGGARASGRWPPPMPTRPDSPGRARTATAPGLGPDAAYAAKARWPPLEVHPCSNMDGPCRGSW